jgi:hypothetical protein
LTAPKASAAVPAGAAPRKGALGPAAKRTQAKPNKSKQNGLDLLGFIRPNRDFSKSYAGKNKKNPVSLPVAPGLSQDAGFDPANEQGYSTGF